VEGKPSFTVAYGLRWLQCGLNTAKRRERKTSPRKWGLKEGSLETITNALGSTIFERIGNTPLVRLSRITAHLPGVQLLGKAEWLNPGGSVKDRAASAIVAAAEARGLLAGKHLLDATSGNTGIAYALLGAAKGFPVTLCMPSNVSPERKHILAAYGAGIVWTDPADGSDGAIRQARELARDHERYYYADQYSNEANWKAHYYGTANEITRSGNKPAGRLRISSPAWEPAAPSLASRAD
jgi:cysteine synthase